jgi:hypothetical protein
VAYAADGSAPGSPLYGLDLAMESARLSLTRSPEARAELALAFADERLAEFQQVLGAGSQADAQLALDGYGVNISQAAAALAAVAAEGDAGRAAALAGLLEASLAVHTQVLTEVRGQLPEQAQPMLDQALLDSQSGLQAVQSVFGQSGPAGLPEGLPGGPPVSEPGAPDQAIPTGPPQGGVAPEGIAPAAEEQGFEDRVAGLGQRAAQAQAAIEAGEFEQAEGIVLEYQSEVEALALELAGIAQQDAARAQALAALLEVALSIHIHTLTQLLPQVPQPAMGAIETALASSQAVAEQWQPWLPQDIPGGVPTGIPSGRP